MRIRGIKGKLEEREGGLLGLFEILRKKKKETREKERKEKGR